MRSFIAAALSGMLFASLAAIYLLQPNLLLLGLIVFILFIGIVIAFSGTARELFMLGVFVMLISSMAVFLYARQSLNEVAASLVAILWAFAFYAIVRVLLQSTLFVPANTLLIAKRLSGLEFRVGTARVWRPLPLFERALAMMPLYNLTTDVPVNDIETKAIQTVKHVLVNVVYKINRDMPMKVYSGPDYPNRISFANEVAQSLKMDRFKAMQDQRFWEELLHKYMHPITDGVLRDVVYAETQRAIDTSTDRERLLDLTREKLQEAVQPLGLEIVGVSFDRIEQEERRLRVYKRQNKINADTEDARLEAERAATRARLVGEAEADVRVYAIIEWIKALQDQEVDLSIDDKQALIRNALKELNELGRPSRLQVEVGTPQAQKE